MAPLAPKTAALTSKADTGSPYQLEKSQVLKASSALLSHIKSESKRKALESSTKNLLGTSDDSSENDDARSLEPLWLIMTTKKHIVDQKRLKPGKIPLPHSLHNSSSTTICLFTADPQRLFKGTIAHPSFPTTLASRITRVLAVSKLGARYKSFESRRQLISEHDVFLADDRIITRLPKMLGKIFYGGTKRPIPVNLQPYKGKGEAVNSATKSKDVSAVASPPHFAKEVETAISCAQIHLSPSTTTSIRVGSSNFKLDQVAENVEAVVEGMVKKFIPKGWRNIRAIHIKGPNTMALPIWLAEEIWQEEDDVLENEEAKEILTLANQKGRKRKAREENTGTLDRQPKQSKRIEDSELSKEMAERRAKLRQQKKEAQDDVDGKPEKQKSAKKPDSDTGKVKVKTKKIKAITAAA